MVTKNHTRPRVLGISGGIGSGKSVFSRILSSLAIPVFDSDSEAKLLYEESKEVKSFICEHFGKDLYNTPDSSLNRKALAKILFSNQEALSLVERLIHPLLKECFEHWCIRQETNWVALESAILFPSDFYLFCDAVVWIEAPLEERLMRIAKRDNATQEEITRRIEAQKEIYPKEMEVPLFRVNNSFFVPLLPQVRAIIEELERKTC